MPSIPCVHFGGSKWKPTMAMVIHKVHWKPIYPLSLAAPQSLLALPYPVCCASDPCPLPTYSQHSLKNSFYSHLQASLPRAHLLCWFRLSLAFFKGRQTGQSCRVQFFQWEMICREDAQWATMTRKTTRCYFSIQIVTLQLHLNYNARFH